MRRIVTGLAAAALVLGAVVISAGPASSAAPSATWAWTLTNVEGACALAKVDLTTAAVTELAGPASAEGCVEDLAAGPDGSVWGIAAEEPDLQPLGFNAPQATSPVRLVRFSTTTGAAVSSVQVDVPGGGSDTWLAHGGIAITSDGTVWIQIVDDACDSGNSVCLYTVNPTTGAATEVGPSTLDTTYLDGLAICGAGPVTLIEPDGGPTAQPQAYPPLYVGSVSASTGSWSRMRSRPSWTPRRARSPPRGPHARRTSPTRRPTSSSPPTRPPSSPRSPRWPRPRTPSTTPCCARPPRAPSPTSGSRSATPWAAAP